MNRLSAILVCVWVALSPIGRGIHAEVILWSDSLDSNAGNRWASSGVWQISSPTVGPSGAHSGAYCVTTQNYPYNADDRIYCKSYLNGSNSLVIPAAEQMPTLYFWHWYNFANALGYVELKVGTNAWQQISPTYLNVTSGGAWEQSSIDLSAYAGQRVQLGFHFTSGGCCGNARGWYVDDLSLTVLRTNPPPQLTVPGTQTNYPGQIWSVMLSATNPAVPNSVFTFSLPARSTNYFLTTAGVLTWTNTGLKNGILTWTNNSVAPGTSTIYVQVTDNGSPALTVTNQFNVIYLPLPPPTLTVPASQTVSVGQSFTNLLSATNTLLPACLFTFALAAPSTNVMVTTNGVLTWTNTTAPPGIYSAQVKVTDNNIPPIVGTTNFSVTVLPLPSQLILTNLAMQTNGGAQFTFTVKTPWTNTQWRIQAATNLSTAATNWLPLFTNTVGTGHSLQFTDLLATNYPLRFYRAIFP